MKGLIICQLKRLQFNTFITILNLDCYKSLVQHFLIRPTSCSFLALSLLFPCSFFVIFLFFSCSFLALSLLFPFFFVIFLFFSYSFPWSFFVIFLLLPCSFFLIFLFFSCSFLNRFFSSFLFLLKWFWTFTI